jgi:type I restriction enzyme S subunit
MMRLETNDSVDRQFAWYWLQTPLVREYINKNAKGTSPTMKKISQGIVASIPFPSSLLVSEQRRIVTDMNALQTQVDALKRLQAETAVELDTLFPAVLGRAFKGEL